MRAINPNILILMLAFVLAACSDGEQRDENMRRLTIVVDVPEQSPTVYLTGNLEALGPWAPDALEMQGTGRKRSVTLDVPVGHAFEYKFTLGSWDREAISRVNIALPNFKLTADQDQDVRHEIVAFKLEPGEYMDDWENSGVLGTLVYWRDVESEFLTETRNVEIWLPPGYDDDPERRYPVIYMHDGQNLFDPRIANTGVDWGVDEAIMRGVERGAHESALVVGAWSSSRRAEEYSPWHDAPSYARFLIEEIMPRVNAEYRTRTDRDNTFVMGSSMGGLLSFYLVMNHSDVFSACGCVSTHVPFSEAVYSKFAAGVVGDGTDVDTPYIVKDIEAGATVPENVRMFFDYGTETLDAEYGPTHDLIRDWLAGQGLADGIDYRIQEYRGAAHNEAAWRARLTDQMTWLLAETDSAGTGAD